MTHKKLRILQISVHGLLRASAPELGRDPDTGGQILYVLELTKALSRHPGVACVELLTRLIDDPAVHCDYAQSVEVINPKASILRMPCGPQGYIRKERLWDHLDQLVEAYLDHLRKGARPPDVIHSHYGDAGYVAMSLSKSLGIPFIHSAHSLGRYKRSTMLTAGGNAEELDRVFNFTRRIEVEEEVLGKASLIIASTDQELMEQYLPYGHFDELKSQVIPPGTDLTRFFPPGRDKSFQGVAENIDRFFQAPGKPLLVCIGRATPRKNLLGLVQAFGADADLRRMANLVIIAGNREEIQGLDATSSQAWESILLAIDKYDLYGHIAIPKNHTPDQIPNYYRLAYSRKGLCVNPSISETFGLTLLEAAATGLPLIATDQGGPKDILNHCQNGLLVDTRNPTAMAQGIKAALSDPGQWRTWSRNGLRGVRKYYAWDIHADNYIKFVNTLCGRKTERRQGNRITPCRP